MIHFIAEASTASTKNPALGVGVLTCILILILIFTRKKS